MLIRVSSTLSVDLFCFWGGFELTCCTPTMIHESICFSTATPRSMMFSASVNILIAESEKELQACG